MNCPNCDAYMYAVDTLDSEYESNCYYDTVEGYCHKCGKTYRWVEVFKFDRIENVEEINPDEHL